MNVGFGPGALVGAFVAGVLVGLGLLHGGIG